MMIEKPHQASTSPNTMVPLYPQNPRTADSAAINLVECILQQNKTLKDQMSHLEKQLGKSRKLSEGLFQQNSTLRTVYKGRTFDIANLMKTISIQRDEEKVDYEHQCFLIKELNYATLREIKSLDHQRNETQKNLQEKVKTVEILSQQKNQLQNLQLIKLKARLQNEISPQTNGKLQRLYDEQCQKNRQLEKEVDQLLIKCTKTRAQARRLIKTGQVDKKVILMERQQYEEELLQIKEENRRYRQELAADKLEFHKAEQQKKIQEDKYNRVSRDLRQQIKRYQNNQKNYNSIAQNREKIRSSLNTSSKNQESLHEQLEQLKSQKNQLLKQIHNCKRRIANYDQEKRQREEVLRQDYRQQVARVSRQIVRNQSNFEDEKQRILGQRAKVEAQIGSLEAEEESLREQIEQYNALIRKHPNPMKEIERIQLNLKLKRK